MSTEVPSTPPATEPPKKKRKQSPAGMNQAQLLELTKAEQIVIAARKAAYKPKLAAREITAPVVTQLDELCKAARKKTADSLQSHTSRKSATISEGLSNGELIVRLQEVQAAAKQKYARSHPEKLADYFVGQHLNGSFSRLEQTSAAIIEKLDSDTLPGISADTITALTDARDAWIESNSTQADESSIASSEREEFTEMVGDIKDQRIAIQFAADAEWQYAHKANAPVRREFQLPLDRPLTVRPVSQKKKP